MGEDIKIIAANLFPFLIGAAIQFHLRPAGGSSELHFGRLDTGMETAPAYTSTLILENW